MQFSGMSHTIEIHTNRFRLMINSFLECNANHFAMNLFPYCAF